MILYIVYLLLLPIVIILVLLSALMNPKIRKNLIDGIRTRVNAKQYIKQHSGNKDIIIMHAASAGEFEQLKPILFLNSFKPKIYLTTRHDIWPHHLVIAKLLNIKCYLINANLYENSKRFNPMLKSFNKFIFNKFDKILTGSEKLKQTLSKMVSPDKIIVTGDSRFDQIAYRVNNPPELSQFNNNSKYIILGSIDDADLPIIKDAVANFKDQCKYIIVPHEVNPSYIKKIEMFLDDININHICLSQTTNASIEDYDSIIIDSVGILLDLYKYADIAYVGAGFSHGVHSVIEPLAQNCVVCYGPEIDILDEAVEITSTCIGHVINNSDELLNIFKLINDEKNLEEKKMKGLEYIKTKMNASEQILQQLIRE